jgi:carboxymethylenebutenolidase
MRSVASIIAAVLLAAFLQTPLLAAPLPEKVQFQSLDGKTLLDGYLFLPSTKSSGKVPAIVMMHGRAGPFSSLAHGRYDASTLSKRHLFWGNHWAERGFIAILVDGFSPRGFPQGFSIHSYQSRPETVNEVTVRPLDAYGALRYLRSRSDVDPSRIVLQGWSNGGSAAIASLSDDILTEIGSRPDDGFRGALVFYPACGLHDRFKDGYHPYAPIRLFSGDNDEEVSAEHCARLVRNSRKLGGDAEITIYPGATHDFDEPSRSRQSVSANVAAFADAVAKADNDVQTMLAK